MRGLSSGHLLCQQSCRRVMVPPVLHAEGRPEPATPAPRRDEAARKHREKPPQEVCFWHVVASHGTTAGHCSNKRVTQP